MKKIFAAISVILFVVSCDRSSGREDVRTDSLQTYAADGVVSDTSTDSQNDSIPVVQDSIGEYSSYQIHLTIETNAGIVNGYTSISPLYFDSDSIKSSEYLIRALADDNRTDSLICYKNRITYNYPGCAENVIMKDKNVLYYLLTDTVIALSDIHKIKINSIHVGDYISGIATPLKLSDKTWINTPPMRCVTLGGYLCYYEIFIYEESKAINDVIKKANDFLLKYNGPEDDDQIDRGLSTIIKKIHGQKVLVVYSCTC